MPSGTTSLPIPSPGITAILSLLLDIPCCDAAMAFSLARPRPLLTNLAQAREVQIPAMRDPRADARPGSCNAGGYHPCEHTHPPPMHQLTERGPRPSLDPAAEVDAIARAARKSKTPCG